MGIGRSRKSKDILNICRRHLKPLLMENFVVAGNNQAAVPERPSLQRHREIDE